MNKEEMKAMQKEILTRQEKAFDLVVNEFKSGKLLEKWEQIGRCKYVFQNLGNRVCERESGHKGAHIFGISYGLQEKGTPK